MTPTFLDYAHVPQPGATYKGHEVHPIMGKSIKPLVDGLVDRVHPMNEPIGTEMFNATGLYMGDWEIVSDAHTGDKWELYNIVNDPAQNNNVADQNPALLQKMSAAYQNYSKNVGNNTDIRLRFDKAKKLKSQESYAIEERRKWEGS
jgi:arylsulfatase A-like enzyme